MILAPDDRLPQGPERWTREALAEAWATERRALKAALADPTVSSVAVTVGIPASGKSSWARDNDQPGLVIFDACWAEPKRRAALARQIRAAGKVAIAVWIRCPLDVARERNAARPVLTRVPDVALARAWVALQHHPPTVAEGWSRVLVQDGQAERIHDAAATHEQKLERAAKAPVSTAWKIIGSKILPALAAAEPGASIPAEVEEHLAALEKLLAKGSTKTAADIAKIGAQIDQRERAAWDKIVAKAIGAPWETAKNEVLVNGWASAKAAKVNAIAAGIVPGLRASIAEGWAKGLTAAEIGKAWGADGLPLEGFGTAEGRAHVLARSAAAELSSDSTRAAQEAAESDWYEWGPTTSKNPDPTHAALRGKRFRWSEPPPGGHPGERHGCHCSAKPVITAAEAKDLKAALALENEEAKPVVAPPKPAAPAPKPAAPKKPTKKPSEPKAEPGGWRPLPTPDLPKSQAPARAPAVPAPARATPAPVAPTAVPKAPAKVVPPAGPKPKPSGVHAPAMEGPLLGSFAPEQIDYGADARGAKGREIVAKLGKGLKPEERDQLVASLISAYPSAVKGKVEIHASTVKDDQVFVSATLVGREATAERTIKRDPKTGEWIMKNELFVIGKDYPPGYGTRALRRQMEAAGKLGIARVQTDAAGGKGSGYGKRYNGYYTWPRLGYDGPVPTEYDKGGKLKVPPELHPGVPRDKLLVSDLMATPEGREWWKANGTTFEASFDPRPGSRSMQVLDAYMKEKGL